MFNDLPLNPVSVFLDIVTKQGQSQFVFVSEKTALVQFELLKTAKESKTATHFVQDDFGVFSVFDTDEITAVQYTGVENITARQEAVQVFQEKMQERHYQKALERSQIDANDLKVGYPMLDETQAVS